MRDSIERASGDARQYDLELERIAETRKAVARFIGAQLDEISFTGPTSSGLNAIANGLDWITVTKSSAISMIIRRTFIPGSLWNGSGVKPVLLETARIGEITPEIVERALTERTKLVGAGEREFLQRVSNRSGRHRRALRRTRRFVFSRCHSDAGRISSRAGSHRFSQRRRAEMDAGPSGAGIIVREEEPARFVATGDDRRLECAIPPISLRNAKSNTPPAAEIRAGRLHPQRNAGFGAAIELLRKSGRRRLPRRILSLTQALKLEITAGFEFLSPDRRKQSLRYFDFSASENPDGSRLRTLLKNDIVVSLRFDRANRSWLRVSPHFYNTYEEITKIAELLNQVAARSPL